jgi:hypothetical protein
MGPSLFGDQIYVFFSAEKGAVSVNRKYVLNDIEQNLVFIPADSKHMDCTGISP